MVEVGTKESPNKGDVRLTNSATGEVTTTPSPVVKRTIEDMLVIAEEDKTPLRQTDVIQSESQEKKRQRQLEQAQKMMKLQGSDIASKGAAPGAVVVVPHHRSQSCNWHYGNNI
jgi:thiamine monophosphate kinase